MSHITYHYLLNTNRLDGKYIYDANHLPNKQLQEKIWNGYLTDRLKKIKSFDQYPDISEEKKEWAKNMIYKIENAPTLKDKTDILFSDAYQRMGLEKILGRPYFGVWGIHTTPANLFGIDPRYKVRLVIDCDTVDPDYIIVKVSNGKYSKVNLAMEKMYMRYSPSIYNKYCRMFNEKDELASDAYSHKKQIRTVSSGVPDIIFFLPRLRFDKSDVEVYKNEI